jgi:hypothetical protein
MEGNVKKAKSSELESENMSVHFSPEFESHKQRNDSKMISFCVGELPPSSCHNTQHSIHPPDAPFQKLSALYPGNREVQDDGASSQAGEENSHIPQLQPANWKDDSKCDIITLFVNLSETDICFSEFTEREWSKLIILQIQSDLQLEKNNIQLLLTRGQVTKDQHDREYQVLIKELKAVESDIRQYEDYISSDCYSFNNETWEYLKNVGRSELRMRKQMYLQQKADLNQKIVKCWEEIQIYHQILTYLNEEEIRRQQRMAEYSANIIHNEELRKHLLQNLLKRITEEQREIQRKKNSVLNEIKTDGPTEWNSKDCILKAQKLGCTFDFMLRHRVYKGRNVHAYNDLVDIFEKRPTYFETSQNVYCNQKLLVCALENHHSRLDQEMVLYLRRLKRTLSSEKERQKRLEMNETCPSVLPGFSDSERVSWDAPVNLSTTSASADQCHEEMYGELSVNRVPEVEAANKKEMKLYSSQPMLQVSSVFREATEDLDIIPSTLSHLKLEQASESTEAEKRLQNETLKSELGPMQQEYGAHKSQQMKSTAEKTAKLECLKKDDSLTDLQQKTEKLTIQVSNTSSKLFKVKKENKTVRKKIDKILDILEKKNGDTKQFDKKKKVLHGHEKFTTQVDRSGLQLPSVEEMKYGGKGTQITKRENTDVFSRNTEEAELQHLLDGHMVTEIKEMNTTMKENTGTFSAQHDKTEWQLHSDIVSGVISPRGVNKGTFVKCRKVGAQPHSEQVLILGNEDASKRETPEEITKHDIRVGLQVSSNENFLSEGENSYVMTEDHAARKRNKMVVQALSLLLDCIKEEDVSKYVMKNVEHIIKGNKSLSPPVIKKLIDTITAHCQPSVPFHDVTSQLAGEEEVVSI